MVGTEYVLVLKKKKKELGQSNRWRQGIRTGRIVGPTGRGNKGAGKAATVFLLQR